MMKSEFEKLTGMYPSTDLYEAIEAAYMDSAYDKQTFCKKYVANEDGIAETIAHNANMKAFAKTSDTAAELDKMQKRVADLETRLERELEWKPLDRDRDNYPQARYDRLRNDSCTRVMTVEEAKDLLYNEFGFAREAVKIYTELPCYEVNRHRMLRKTGETYERLPLYNATDWNYIRFDCGRMCYELVNDELQPFLF